MSSTSSSELSPPLLPAHSSLPPVPAAPSPQMLDGAWHQRPRTAPQAAELCAAPAVPAPYIPPRRSVPQFPPIRPGGRGGRRLLRRAVRRRRGPLAVGLAVAATVLTVSATHGASPQRTQAASTRPTSATAHRPPPEPLVRAPVRIADAAVVTLLQPGDRVDVLAGGKVLAAAVPVVAVPGDTGSPLVSGTLRDPSAGSAGALIVLSVPRRTAAALSGASASTPLGVALC
jgi:hypothetical protein